MDDTKHEGWTNYETWAVKLHMDNDETAYNYWRLLTTGIAEHANGPGRTAAGLLADHLKARHEEQLPELQGFAADLLTAAFGEVNWYEIAESLLEAVRENAIA